jgi:hypothetical protein
MGQPCAKDSKMDLGILHGAVRYVAQLRNRSFVLHTAMPVHTENSFWFSRPEDFA